jgi:hypothetical protein
MPVPKLNSKGGFKMALIGNMLDISVGSDGTTYGINNQLQVFRRLEIWERVDDDFNAVQVAVGDSANVWAIEADSNSVCYLQNGRFEKSGSSLALRISVGIGDPSQVWIRGTNDMTYKLVQGGFVQTPSGSKALEIAVFNETMVWIIGTNNKTYELKDGKFVQTPSGSEGKQITIDASMNVWLVGTNDQYYQLVGGKFTKSSIPWGGSGLSSLLAINRLFPNS